MSQEDAAALKDFLHQVSTMKVHRSARYGVAKKKQLFVLLLIARIGNRRLASNRVHFSDVEEELGDLISRFGGRSEIDGPKPEQPFFHLSSSPFWKVHLAEQTVKNAQATPAMNVKSNKMDTVQMQYFSSSLIDPQVQMLLKPYIAERLG